MPDGDHEHWLSYQELADVLCCTANAARMHAVRRGWPRRAPNRIGDCARVLVPEDVVVQGRMTHTIELCDAHMQRRATHTVAQLNGDVQANNRSVFDAQFDAQRPVFDARLIRETIEASIKPVVEQLAVTNQEIASLRAELLEARTAEVEARAAERAAAERATAANDRAEAATADLQRQLEVAQKRIEGERIRADQERERGAEARGRAAEAEKRANDAIAAERITSGAMSGLRAELEQRRDWSLVRRLRWAISNR